MEEGQTAHMDVSTNQPYYFLLKAAVMASAVCERLVKRLAPKAFKINGMFLPDNTPVKFKKEALEEEEKEEVEQPVEVGAETSIIFFPTLEAFIHELNHYDYNAKLRLQKYHADKTFMFPGMSIQTGATYLILSLQTGGELLYWNALISYYAEMGGQTVTPFPFTRAQLEVDVEWAFTAIREMVERETGRNVLVNGHRLLPDEAFENIGTTALIDVRQRRIKGLDAA